MAAVSWKFMHFTCSQQQQQQTHGSTHIGCKLLRAFLKVIPKNYKWHQQHKHLRQWQLNYNNITRSTSIMWSCLRRKHKLTHANCSTRARPFIPSTNTNNPFARHALALPYLSATQSQTYNRAIQASNPPTPTTSHSVLARRPPPH